jgi:hypothetical protein
LILQGRPRRGGDLEEAHMRKLQIPLALGALLCAAALPARAEIFNGTYKRNDGYFLPHFFSGGSPRTTIMRGFCYDFDLNGDFIDLTEKVSSSSSGITQLSRTRTRNGAQNTVNGHGMGQITVHFCVSGNTSGDKVIKVLNFGGGEFDRLTVSVTKGGKWTDFHASMTPIRVNIPFQFTVNGSDLRDATIEGAGIRRINDPEDVNTDDRLEMTLVFDANVGAQTGNQVLFLRRFAGGTGSPVTDPGMVRNASGSSGMIVAVTGSAPLTGTQPVFHPPISGGTPAPVTAAGIEDLKLNAVLGKSLRHVAAFRKIDETFCQGFAVPPRGGATERDITVPNWGLSVSNPTAGGFTAGGSVQLIGPQPAPAAIQLQALAGLASIAVPFSRPTNTSRAILILPTTDIATKNLYGGRNAIGCYQAVMRATDPRNWVDPPFALRLFDNGGRPVHSIAF